ncbi:MAG: hypothetical protein IKQ46_14125, partial [Bacteroidales bacterium]|nr:hypothetical protein [Bacteroidales bacterium]
GGYCRVRANTPRLFYAVVSRLCVVIGLVRMVKIGFYGMCKNGNFPKKISIRKKRKNLIRKSFITR